MDFIFIIGQSAVGKTTLAKERYQHYRGVYIEQTWFLMMLKMLYIMQNSYEPLLDYDYQLDDEHNYLSWVQSQNLK